MAGYSRAVRVGKHVQVIKTPSVKIENRVGIKRGGRGSIESVFFESGSFRIRSSPQTLLFCFPPSSSGMSECLFFGTPSAQVAGTTATSPDGSGVLCVGDVEGQTQYIFHIIALALREVEYFPYK